LEATQNKVRALKSELLARSVLQTINETQQTTTQTSNQDLLHSLDKFDINPER